ncbi:hypothetical protein GCM10025883_37390 [Mobilicoccus caccae]|uniref:5-deoxy-glucuronate isomerase n=1 Tax=Mobilicoccus caccae TaxID=1859295 RepID=A0ABQ6IUT3_9MICO|nr:hypothetical protein GCM10025883_37390 [Mobilicoccus caccae]
MTDWFKPAHTTGDDGFDVSVIRPGDSGWEHTGLLVADLADGDSRTVTTEDCEYIVLPLSGASTVSVTAAGETQRFELAGRPDVFSGPTDLVYVPRDAEFTVTATAGGGRYAFPFAKARTAFPVVKVEAGDVPVELRGAGQASRQVQNFGTPDTLEADSIIACEVITPAGNWSSYPRTSTTRTAPGSSRAWRRSTTSRCGRSLERPRESTRSDTRGSTAPTTDRSRFSPRCVAATRCWCRTGGTVRRWPRPGTTCTTSTSWPDPAKSGSG